MVPQGSISFCSALCSWPEHQGGQCMWQRTSVHVMMDQKAEQELTRMPLFSNLLPLLMLKFSKFPEPPQIVVLDEVIPFKTCECGGHFKFTPYYLP